MLFSIALLISTVFLFFEFKGVKQSTRQIFLFIQSAMVFLLVAFNRMNPDYLGYSARFEQGYQGYEPGFVLLFNIFKSINLTFESVLILLAILIVGVVYVLSQTYTHHGSLIFLYYILFPLVFDLTQLRNTFMYLVILLFVLLNRSQNRWITTIGVLSGASLHLLGFLYLPFIWMTRIKRKSFAARIIVTFILLTLFSIALRIASLKFNLHKEIAEELDAFEWFYFMIQVVHAGIDLVTYMFIDQRLRSEGRPQSDREEVLFRFGLYSLLYLPLASLSTEMYRFRRNAQLVKYAYSAMAMKQLKAWERTAVFALLTLSIGLTFVMMYIAGDLGLFAVFDNNLILSMIQKHF